MTRAKGELGFESMDNFMIHTLEAFPDASVEQDNYGQLVVYTNLTVNDEGAVVTFEEDIP